MLSSARCTEAMRSKARTLSDMKHSVGLAVVLTLAVLVAANGAYAWGATSGMEVALFSVMKDNRDKLRMASRRSPECGGNSASSSTASLHLSSRDRGHTCAFTSRNGKGK